MIGFTVGAKRWVGRLKVDGAPKLQFTPISDPTLLGIPVRGTDSNPLPSERLKKISKRVKVPFGRGDFSLFPDRFLLFPDFFHLLNDRPSTC